MACVMVSVIGLIYNYSLSRLAYTMLVVLIVFYILSTILQRIVLKNIDEAFKNKSNISNEMIDKDDVNKDLNEEVQSISPKSEDAIE